MGHPSEIRKRNNKLPREYRVCVASFCETVFECRVDGTKKYCSCRCSNQAEAKTRKHVSWNKGLTKYTDERVYSQSEKIKGKKRDPCSEETKRKISLANSGRIISEETRRKLSQSHIGQKRPHTEETKKKIGKANVENMKRLWRDPEYIRMQMHAHNVCPNKGEMRLDFILQKLFPNEYKFVGDGQFILARKCPDFININGQKKIIELFGEHVHTAEEAVARCSLFSEYGYQTLIVWFKEIWDMPNLVSKLISFNERPTNAK